MAINNSVNAQQQGFQSLNATTGVWAGRSLTAGTGISITNNDGTGGNPTISAASGAFSWNDVTTSTQTIAVGNGYVTDRGAGVAYTLPATAVFGDEFAISGKLGLWTIAQAAGQQINFGQASTTAGVTGSLAATNLGDSIQVLCTTAGASTIWRVLNAVGNITIA
jgi:hypothetical protein